MHYFNIGNEQEEVAIGELAQRILATGDIQADIKEQVADHDPIKRRCLDISRARQILKYAPEVTLDEGLKLTLAWYAGRFKA